MSNIEKIKAEIERLKIDYLNRSYTFVPATMEQLLDFIDSMPEEKPSDDLEEAAGEYASDGSIGFIDMTAYNAFIAGAEWQKKHLRVVLTSEEIIMPYATKIQSEY